MTKDILSVLLLSTLLVQALALVMRPDPPKFVEIYEPRYYRLYHPNSRGFIVDDKEEINTKISDGFDKKAVWELIVMDEFNGFYLRNNLTKSYLCFNDYGLPLPDRAIQWDKDCLLKSYFPVEKLQRKVMDFEVSDNLRPINDLDLFQPPRRVMIAVQDYEIPTYLGFCKNGEAYENMEAYRPNCSYNDLGTEWNVVTICPAITQNCRYIRGCKLIDRPDILKYHCPAKCVNEILCSGLLTPK